MKKFTVHNIIVPHVLPIIIELVATMVCVSSTVSTLGFMTFSFSSIIIGEMIACDQCELAWHIDCIPGEFFHLLLKSFIRYLFLTISWVRNKLKK
jgi:hypothetical protein